jgi:transposase
MIEPTGCVQCCARSGTYCDRCDLLVGLPGLHVIRVAKDGPGLVVAVESPPTPVGCPLCGVIATSHGRRSVWLVDAPSFGRPVRIVWRKRTWRCSEPACPSRSFTEQDERIARPRGLLTTRACWWAISQLRTEHASVYGLARQLGTTWRTVWRSIEPLLQAMADDPARFDGVTSLGVDEHLWHHVSERDRGPRALTGMVDLTRDQDGCTRARLLDLVPGRSGKAYADWLGRCQVVCVNT